MLNIQASLDLSVTTTTMMMMMMMMSFHIGHRRGAVEQPSLQTADGASSPR